MFHKLVVVQFLGVHWPWVLAAVAAYFGVSTDQLKTSIITGVTIGVCFFGLYLVFRFVSWAPRQSMACVLSFVLATVFELYMERQRTESDSGN